MGLEYFPNSKYSVEKWRSHSHFTECGVWVLNPTPLYRECLIHYGYEYNVETGAYENEIKREDLFTEYHYSLKYHTSWDWLIPVAQKIYEKKEYYKYVNEQSSMFALELMSVLQLEPIYEKIVDFITWYNSQK